MAKIIIKPAEGVKVRDPQSTLHIPENGIEVESSTYWLRKIAAGDVVKIDKIEPAPKKADLSSREPEQVSEKKIAPQSAAVPKQQINTRNK